MNTTRDVEPAPSQRIDPLLYRMIVGALAVGFVVIILGGLILAAMDKQIPGELIALGGLAGGALGGLLVPSPSV